MSRKMNKIGDFYPETKEELLTAFRLKAIRDNLVMITGNDLSEIKLYNTNDPSKVQLTLLDPCATSISCLQVLSASSHLVSGSERGLIAVFDLETAKPVTTYAKHLTAITSIQSFFHQESLFVSGSLDTSIRVWDIRQKNEVAVFKGHSGQINTIDVSPDNAWTISGSSDGTVKFWNNSQGKMFQEIRSDSNNSIVSLMVNPYDFQIAFGGIDRSVTFYNIDNWKLQSKMAIAASPVTCLAYDDYGTSVYVLGNNYMKVISPKSFDICEIIETSWKNPTDICFFGGDIYGLGKLNGGCRLFKAAINVEKQEDFQSVRQEGMIIEEPIAPKGMSEADELAEIKSLRAGHAKIFRLMEDKRNSISTVVNFFFEQGNFNGAKIAIEKIYEPRNITDVLNLFLENKTLDRISIEFATLLLKKSTLLFEDKYKFYIKTALRFAIDAMKRFAQDIVSLKSFSQMSKYDIERDERIKKYDAFLAEVDAMVKHKVFSKLKTMFQQEEIGELSQNLVNDYTFILDAVKRAPA
jgi:hypothetical protein